MLENAKAFRKAEPEVCKTLWVQNIFDRNFCSDKIKSNQIGDEFEKKMIYQKISIFVKL